MPPNVSKTNVVSTTGRSAQTKREVGDEAVWSLSTAKPGNGVVQLRDDNTDTYWQSDGSQPHLINIQFSKKMSLVELAFYLDFKLDESYTPKKLALRVGTTFHDLREVHTVELEEPMGWVYLDLGYVASQQKQKNEYLRAHFLQVEVLAMHQNGRDTHIRQVKVYGPRSTYLQNYCVSESGFSSIDFRQFDVIR